MTNIKNINLKAYTNEYNLIREVVYAWQNNEPMATDLVAPSAVLEAAAKIYSHMYEKDHDLECNPLDLKSDYDKIISFWDMLKQGYANEKALGSSISELGNCLEKIILLTQTQKITQGKGEETIDYGIITADLSFRILYEIFDNEVLGAPVEDSSEQF